MKTATKSKVKAPQPSSSTEGKNVLEILHHDHQTVAELFFQYSELEKNDEKAKNELAAEIVQALFIHAKAEEELVYPAARKGGDEAQDMMDEADTEHHVVKFLLAELAQMSAGDDHFDSKICVLGELVNHHVQEEEKEIFETLRESNVDLEALGEKLIRRKEDLAKTPMPKGAAILTNSRLSTKKK